jgi:hypothetical protein
MVWIRHYDEGTCFFHAGFIDETIGRRIHLLKVVFSVRKNEQRG